ncbi:MULTISPECIES: ribosomal protein S18-alanine N-acetyltransferase [Legionella]|uniref:[Ribosomal protein bS18]-alanine N-acetyltransferase n=1 Tax=Legionella resiliens TaxID=2905958 RepID=A0ABS8X6W8_9GAMM|nr:MULTISPECIES: ribosomal protein S18-alanine N-acetyltransferase [unclassified Legionella]MCE0723870.1 ribosomal protein S18-alanine N-acetyltransferase [Legionella sp. 9fVS26]MCE3533022.1 ribosomal protein S18-alanine N-acetyltransferase [Legionella sp. 8cVS16]QLZ69214.1 ribosomal-protein-alanine N-acetyltransferase [Legionella sp. PC1000]
MTFNIRRMAESDIDAVYAIEKEVHIAPWDRDILRDCVRVGYDCRVFEVILESSLMICGYIISRHSNNCCHILNFCIAKPYQSQGYGRQFLHQVLSSLTESQYIDHVILEVRPSNKAALHLYQSMGFEQIEIKPAYYIEENNIEDAIVLKKKLSI